MIIQRAEFKKKEQQNSNILKQMGEDVVSVKQEQDVIMELSEKFKKTLENESHDSKMKNSMDRLEDKIFF